MAESASTRRNLTEAEARTWATACTAAEALAYDVVALGLAAVVTLDVGRRRVTVHIGDADDDTMPAPPPRRWLAGGGDGAQA